MRAACHVMLAVAAVPLLVAIAPVAPASASPGAEGDETVTCPPAVAGVPFTTEPEFAGTTRPLANGQGVLVRFSLLCPYAQAGSAPVFALTLDYSLFETEDLQCEELEITSEEADAGGIQGVLDDPNVSARVTYQGRSAEDLPAIRDAATQLLADVPSDAYPCEGGPATGVDGVVAVPEDRADEDEVGVGALAVFAVVAGFAALLVVGAMIAGRLRKRRGRKAAAPATSGIEGLEVFRRQRPDPVDLPATQSPGECWARVAEMDREVQEADLRRDALAASIEQLRVEEEAVDAGLRATRADLATQQAHVAAIRSVAASDRDRIAYLSSYAGLTTLAAACTNLLAAGGRRAAALVPDDAVRQGAQELDDVARATGAAAELGLEDSRYWLWGDRRQAMAHALAVLTAVAPRQAELQHRLVVQVQRTAQRRRDLVRRHEEALAALAAEDEALAHLIEERNRQATTAQILEERARGDLVPVR